MADYVYSDSGTPVLGQILAANVVISTPYNSTAWTPAGNLTAPADGFKLFYAKQAGATTFYGYDSNGKIYSSTNLSAWTNVNQVALDSSKQLIGIDSSGNPLAIATSPVTDQYGNTTHYVYAGSGSSWTSYDSLENIKPGPINPTYYTNASLDYLIYQDEDNNVNQHLFSDSNPPEIGSNPGPSIPSSFTNSLLVYDGNNLTLYAY